MRPVDVFSFPSYHSKSKKLVTRRFDVTLTNYTVKRSQLVKLNHLHVIFVIPYAIN